MGKIILMLLSEIDGLLVEGLKRGLEKTFNRKVEVRYQQRNLKYAYDPHRRQYKSPSLLSYLRRFKKASGDKILGVADVDLYSPGYDFVYGEADMNSGVATLSISRLKEADRSLFDGVNVIADRSIREAVHEVGHLFGLGHCKNPKCAMRTCTCVEEVDEAGNVPCAKCRAQLNANLPSGKTEDE